MTQNFTSRPNTFLFLYTSACHLCHCAYRLQMRPMIKSFWRDLQDPSNISQLTHSWKKRNNSKCYEPTRRKRRIIAPADLHDLEVLFLLLSIWEKIRIKASIEYRKSQLLFETSFLSLSFCWLANSFMLKMNWLTINKWHKVKESHFI